MAVSIALIAGGVLLIASGGSSSPHRIRVDLNAIAQASLQPVHVHMVSDGGPGGHAVVDGVFDLAHRTYRLVQQPSHGPRVETLSVDGVFYTNPYFFADATPDMIGPTHAQVAAYMRGRHWLVFQPKPSKRHPSDGFNAQVAGGVTELGFFGGPDVASILRQLAKAGVKVIDAGPSHIDGVTVEHFRIRYSQNDFFSHPTDKASDFPITTLDIWVNESNEELRAEMSTPAMHNSSVDQDASHMVSTFSDYGVPVHVAAPKASDTLPLDPFFAWLSAHTRPSEQAILNAGPSAPASMITATTTTTRG